jgi:hypothetical protein
MITVKGLADVVQIALEELLVVVGPARRVQGPHRQTREDLFGLLAEG